MLPLWLLSFKGSASHTTKTRCEEDFNNTDTGMQMAVFSDNKAAPDVIEKVVDSKRIVESKIDSSQKKFTQ